jgi:hypothetical protein
MREPDGSVPEVVWRFLSVPLASYFKRIMGTSRHGIRVQYESRAKRPNPMAIKAVLVDDSNVVPRH